MACQIQSFVSAVYGYRNLATRGFQTAGCFGGNSRRSLELIQLSNKNGNQIASKTSSRSFPFQATSPVIFHSCGYPVTFLRMTFSFCVPSNQQKPLREPSILGLDGMLTSSSLPGMWQRCHPEHPNSWQVESYPEQKGTSFSVANVARAKRNHIFK